jgi:hypothetical protein
MTAAMQKKNDGRSVCRTVFSEITVAKVSPRDRVRQVDVIR